MEFLEVFNSSRTAKLALTYKSEGGGSLKAPQLFNAQIELRFNAGSRGREKGQFFLCFSLLQFFIINGKLALCGL